MSSDLNENENDDLMADFSDILGDEEVYDVITMTDDNGNEKDFFVVDAIDVEDTRYLLVVESDKFDQDEPEALLIKEIDADGDELIYDIVEDDAEYNKVIVLLQDNDGDYEMKF